MTLVNLMNSQRHGVSMQVDNVVDLTEKPNTDIPPYIHTHSLNLFYVNCFLSAYDQDLKWGGRWGMLVGGRERYPGGWGATQDQDLKGSYPIFVLLAEGLLRHCPHRNNMNTERRVDRKGGSNTPNFVSDRVWGWKNPNNMHTSDLSGEHRQALVPLAELAAEAVKTKQQITSCLHKNNKEHKTKININAQSSLLHTMP